MTILALDNTIRTSEALKSLQLPIRWAAVAKEEKLSAKQLEKCLVPVTTLSLRKKVKHTLSVHHLEKVPRTTIPDLAIITNQINL